MAHPFQGQHQVHPSQMQSHHQNIGQQRQAPVAQQQGPAMGQQRGMQMPNSAHNSTSNYNPQVALFTFERQKGAEGWEDVEAEQQHVNIQDLQNDVKKFQKSRNSVKRIMEEIPSTNARRLVNELVEEQNQKLMAINRTLQWTIASIDIKWKILSRSKRQLQRISVILQTGPSGYEDPHAVRAAAGMGAKVQPGNQNASFPQQNHLAQDMQQPLRNPPQPGQPQMMQQPTQPMRPPQSHPQPGQGQLPPQQPPHPGLAHLPPPPAGATPLSHLPPPPPGVAPLSHLPPPPPGMPRQQPHAQQPRPMPGAFPGPPSYMRPGQPDIEILDAASRRKQKKHGGRQEESSSSESESDSDEWESESGDSVPDHFRVRNVEHGEFAHIGKPKRGRSRQSSRSKKPRHNRSHSKVRNRSRSHGRSDNYRKRRDSDLIEPPPMGKYSSSSSKDSSPRSSKQQLPPIHIHMTTPAAEKTSRPSERTRRDSHGASSPDYRKEKFSAEPMSRGDSWDRHSGTASYNDNSSVHTADDSIFSEPERHSHRSVHRSDIIDDGPKLRSRNLPPRRESFGNPHPSHIYGDVDLRARRPTYPANDYPHDARQREAFFDDEHAYAARPSLVPRRTSTSNGIQTPQSNPFDTSRYPGAPPPPPRLGRAHTMGPGMMHEALYAQREPRYLSDRPAQDSLHLDELADAIEHVREQKRRPLQGRRASEYDRLGGYARAYDLYERRY